MNIAPSRRYMNNEITPAQKAMHITSITDHEPKMNQLIRALLWIGSRMDTLVLYAEFLPRCRYGYWLYPALQSARDFRDLLDALAAMAIPPTQSA